MLRVALCEDEPAELARTAALLEEYFQARPDQEGQVSLYAGGGALLEGVEAQGGFDLYLLDILLPDLDGIQLGRRLRALGDGGEIIYLTISSDYAVDSYEVRAFFYLLKPVDREKLFQVLDSVVDALDRRRTRGVLVSTQNGPRRILLDQILYVERVGRRMRYYCTDGTVDTQTIRASFQEEVRPLLDDRRFCLCGVSFLLNLEHVAGVEGRTALLDNGERLTLPRSASGFKHVWGRFWLERGPV